MNKQRGSSSIFFILVILLISILIVGSAFYFKKVKEDTKVNILKQTNASQSSKNINITDDNSAFRSTRTQYSMVSIEPDYSCEKDDDCEVKNFTSCCGYNPSCANKNTLITHPDVVQKRCQELGVSSTCGFIEVKGCKCIDKKCANF
ncbi:hypothetical protein HY383_03300 [Candidatus Daviesbacteria bacterium]|nr:hypothetical protein [Candidatus Daviesbacteria bacterium]